MSTYPKLKFQLNIELDNEMGFQFMGVNTGGVDFGAGIVSMYPELSRAKEIEGDERRSLIADFVKKNYSNNKEDIENKLREMEKDWNSVASDYFAGVDKVFGNPVWTQGDYICYLSIFDCNPRFLESKSFQVYYKHRQGTNHVIAHEMLHFVFFDYLHTKESEFNGNVDEHTIWLLSEWFNDLVLELPNFAKFGQHTKDSYPEVDKFSKQFKNKSKIADIKSFFEVTKPVITSKP